MKCKRNEKGEGSVFQRSDGRWVAKISKNGVTKSKVARSEKDAIKKLEELKNNEKRNERLKRNKSSLFNKPEKISTSEMFERFLHYKKVGRKKVAETSYIRIESTVRENIIPECGDIPFLEINKKTIESLLDKKKKEGFSYSTVKKIKEAFSMCFKFAVYEEQIIEPYENPTLGVVMPTYDMTLKEIPVYNSDEIKKITNECLRIKENGQYVYRYGPLFLFILNTGLREGEACALLKSDIDIKNRLVFINKNAVSVRIKMSESKEKWVCKIKNSPKTRNSVRYVPLNVGAIKYAKIILEQFNKGPRFVYTVNNKIIKPNSLNKYFDNILKNAKVEKKGGVHALRDTFASRLFDSGTDIQTISKILGHANSKITEEHYIKILDSKKMQAVNLIDHI